jgi:hypothetical protein
MGRMTLAARRLRRGATVAVRLAYSIAGFFVKPFAPPRLASGGE